MTKPPKYPAYDPATDGNRFEWITQAVADLRANPRPAAQVRFTHGNRRGGLGPELPEGGFRPLVELGSYWDGF